MISKKILSGVIGMFLIGSLGTASAQGFDLAASTTAQSDYLFRGQSLSGNNFSIGAYGEAANFPSGYFVFGEFNSINDSLSGDSGIRIELGGGRRTFLFGGQLTTALAYIDNPVTVDLDSTVELRGQYVYPLSESFAVKGAAAYLVDDRINNGYAEIGVLINPAVDYRGGVSTSTVWYDSTNTWEYNNTQIFVEKDFRVFQHPVAAFAVLSHGGNTDVADLDTQFTVGFRVEFLSTKFL